MISSLSPSLVNVRTSQAKQKSVISPQSPLFAGKKDTVSFNKQSSNAASPASLKQSLLFALLLTGGASAAAVPAKSDVLGHHHRVSNPFDDMYTDFAPIVDHKQHKVTNFFKRSQDLPTINDTIASLVPGLTEPQALEMLQRPPFGVLDKNYMNNATYADVSALPAASRTISDDEVKSNLKDTLNARFGKNSAQVDDAMALFGNAEFVASVPDARLRGAIINLQGTVGEAAINAYKNGVFGSVKFVDLPPNLIAHVIQNLNETLPKVEINGRYSSEDFRLLSGSMGHEALHSDLNLSVSEERIAHALDTLVHMQMILENPDLIKTPTELTQRTNTKAMARLNTRDKDGTLRLFTSQGNVYPGSKTSLGSFGANFEDTGVDTTGINFGPTSPGNSVLRGQLKKATGVTNDTADFDSATEGDIEHGQTVFDPVSAIAIAKVLKLDTGDIPQSRPSSTSASQPPASTKKPDPSHTPMPTPAPATSGAKRRHNILGFQF